MARLVRLSLLVLVCFFCAEYTSWRIEQRLRMPARAPGKTVRKPVAWRKPPPFDPRSDIEVRLPPGTVTWSPAPEEAPGPDFPRCDTPRPVPVGAPPRSKERREPAANADPARPQESEPMAPAYAPSGVQRMSRSELQELFLSTDEWVDGITMKRARQGDQVIGVYLNYEGNESPLPRLGIQPGDILTGVNGHPLQNQEDYRWAGHALRDGGRFDIQVLRQGVPVTLSFEIVNDR